MQVNRGIVECVAPIDHGGVVMGVRNRDGGKTAQRFHALDGELVKKADAVPEDISFRRLNGIRSLADGNLGSVIIDVTPGSCSSNLFSVFSRISSSVVHCCPSHPTNCLGSSQIAHCSTASANCVPQVIQIRFIIFALAPILASRSMLSL